MSCRLGCVFVCGSSMFVIVSVPEWFNGVDSSSTVFAFVGTNHTADTYTTFLGVSCYAVLHEIYRLHVDVSLTQRICLHAQSLVPTPIMPQYLRALNMCLQLFDSESRDFF